MIGRQTDRHREIQRQTTEIQICIHTDKQTDGHTGMHTDTLTYRQTDRDKSDTGNITWRKLDRDRQTETEAENWMDRQLDRDRETQEKLMQIERDEKTDIPTVKQTDRQTDRGRQMDGWTKRHTEKNQVD